MCLDASFAKASILMLTFLMLTFSKFVFSILILKCLCLAYVFWAYAFGAYIFDANSVVDPCGLGSCVPVTFLDLHALFPVFNFYILEAFLSVGLFWWPMFLHLHFHPYPLMWDSHILVLAFFCLVFWLSTFFKPFGSPYLGSPFLGSLYLDHFS